MISKPADTITKADLDALVTNKVAEGKTFEYKLTAPGGTDDQKREFLADVSSFGNASGGDLLLGVAADDGVPTSIPGLKDFNEDAEKLRLEGIIRDGIQPRLPGVQLKAIPGFGDGPVLLLRVPRSFAAPHMVVFRNYSRFYARNSGGKYQMDVGELRAAFAASETLSEKIQQFRADRVAKIIAGEGPVRMPSDPKMILHLLPLTSFSGPPSTNVLRPVDARLLFPIGASSGWNDRYNLDGFLTHNGSPASKGEAYSYCQYFRFGGIEAVSAFITYEKGGGKFLRRDYENKLIACLPSYLEFLKKNDVLPPILVTLSMTGVRGARIEPTHPWGIELPDIDRDCLLLPDVLLESYDADPAQVMRPIFDAVWNAAGVERSFNYDEKGIWHSWS
jgi:hypothetical protein